MTQAQELTRGAGLDRAVGTDRRARPDPASARPRAGTGQDTLTSLLDRLETGGLIIRSLDPHDRRARIPQVTTGGRRTQARITRARDHTEAELLKHLAPKSNTCCATCSPASRPTSEATACTPEAPASNSQAVLSRPAKGRTRLLRNLARPASGKARPSSGRARLLSACG
jgi:hypothetical protein